MVNPFGGTKLDEPLVFRLEHPIRHRFRTYTELTFRRRASMGDLAAAQGVADDRKMMSMVLARLAKVPKGVVDKLHPKDLVDLTNGTKPLFELV